jgi:NADP-dependent 3-hydroxy acid dehydrogenase YdfG
MPEFTGRAIIVTGASSGIGRVTAITLGALGAELWLVGRSDSELAETARLVAEAGGPPAHTAAMDLQVRGPLTELITQVAARHPYLFGIISNAGLMYPEPILSGTIDRWQAMLDVNIMAMLEGSKAAIEAMRANGKPGHIVNVGSLQSRFEVGGVYGLTKKGVEIIGASLRAELEEDDIRVTTIVPGGFATQLARGLAPAEMKKIAAKLDSMGIEMGAPGSERILGDPQYIADAIAYVMKQPPEINFQEILIRPPVDMKI